MANFFTAWLFSKLRAFCIPWIWPIMPVVVPACIIENQLILHSSNGGFEMWQLEFRSIFCPNWSIYQKYLCRPISRKMREVRDTNFHRFCHRPAPLTVPCAPAFMAGQINRRNFQTEIETEANKWSKFGRCPSTETVYGSEGPLSGL